MARDWIERQNAAFARQASGFSATINSDPSAFGIPPAEAALLAAEYADFAEAARAAEAPHTRTSSAIFARNAARLRLAARMRDLGARIRANPAVSDAQRFNLALSLPRARGGRTVLSPPASRPIVRIRSVVNNLITIRLVDEQSSLRRTRPPHVAGALLFFHAGDDPSSNLSDWSPAGITLSSKAIIALPFLPPGTQVWIAARWFNGRSQGGPISNEVSTYVGRMIGPLRMVA